MDQVVVAALADLASRVLRRGATPSGVLPVVEVTRALLGASALSACDCVPEEVFADAAERSLQEAASRQLMSFAAQGGSLWLETPAGNRTTPTDEMQLRLQYGAEDLIAELEPGLGAEVLASVGLALTRVAAALAAAHGCPSPAFAALARGRYRVESERRVSRLATTWGAHGAYREVQ